MNDKAISPHEVEDALQRILGSENFAQAHRHRRFLRHVVNASLNGNTDELRGPAIAVTVFERGDDFDPQSDPLVRIEAGRLRQRLAEYYAGAGRDDPLRITIPRGAYVASFEYAQHHAAGPPAGLPGGPWSWRLAAALAAIGILIAVDQFAGRDSGPLSESIAAVPITGLPDWPRIYVAQFADLSPSAELEYFGLGITDELIMQLRNYELLVVAGYLATETDAHPSVAGLRDQYDIDYILSGTLRRSGDSIRILPRLLDTSSGRILWGEAFERTNDVDSLILTQQQIAEVVARTIALPYGPIYEQEFSQLSRSRPDRYATYDCLLRYYAYRRQVNVALIEETRACFEAAVEAEPGFADAWGGLALMRMDSILYEVDMQAADPGAAVYDAAVRALDIDSNSVLGHSAMARYRFLSGDLDGFANSMERLLEIGRTDPQVLINLSQALVMLGDTKRGAALAESARELDPNPSIHFAIVDMLLGLSTGDYDAALAAALQIDAPNWYPSAVFVAIAAGMAGESDIAERAVERLLVLEPDFAAGARELFRTFNLSPELTHTYITGLRRAGLEID